jgi:hypothetical protein
MGPSVSETNIRSKDRILSLSVVDGEKAKSSTGLVDTRLFTGDQQLHLKMEPETCLWYFQYSNNGMLPQGLQGKYTGFKAGIKMAEDYFRKRNIRITEIKD